MLPRMRFQRFRINGLFNSETSHLSVDSRVTAPNWRRPGPVAQSASRRRAVGALPVIGSTTTARSHATGAGAVAALCGGPDDGGPRLRAVVGTLGRSGQEWRCRQGTSDRRTRGSVAGVVSAAGCSRSIHAPYRARVVCTPGARCTRTSPPTPLPENAIGGSGLHPAGRGRGSGRSPHASDDPER